MRSVFSWLVSREGLTVLVLVLIPVVAWQVVLWREHQQRQQRLLAMREEAVAWSRKWKAMRQTRRGFAVGNPFPALNVPSETFGRVPVYERGKPVLLWFPLWFEGAAAWKPEQWQGWRDLLARCPNLHLVGVVVTPSAYASSNRRDLQQLYRALQHPRIGFWMMVSDEWANDDTGVRNPFIQKQVILLDSRGTIRYRGILRRSMPSEAERQQLEAEYRKLG